MSGSICFSLFDAFDLKRLFGVITGFVAKDFVGVFVVVELFVEVIEVVEVEVLVVVDVAEDEDTEEEEEEED